MHLPSYMVKSPITISWDFMKINKTLFYLDTFTNSFTPEKHYSLLRYLREQLVKNFYSNLMPPKSFVYCWKELAKVVGFSDWYEMAVKYTKKRRNKRKKRKHESKIDYIAYVNKPRTKRGNRHGFS